MGKLVLARLTPPILTSIVAAVLAVLAAFHVPLTLAEQAATVAFVAAGAVVLLRYRTIESISALVTAAIAVAIAYGLPVSTAQETSILALTGLLALVVGVKGTVSVVTARRLAAQGKPADRTLTITVDADTSSATEALEKLNALAVATSDRLTSLLERERGRPPHAEDGPGVGSYFGSDGHPTFERLTWMRKHRAGRLQAFLPPRLKDFTAYLTAALAPAPEAWPVPQVALPMDGNDKYGDCTIAGIAHLIAAWNTVFKRALKVPTLKQIISTYLKLSPHDTGCVEANVLQTMFTTGLFGEKIDGYAPIKNPSLPSGIELIKQAIVNYGAVYLGILCPESAELQFENHEAWTNKGEKTADGHCVVGLGFTKQGLLCSTWGGIALLTWGFLEPYLQEAWVILPQQLVEAKKNTLGIDLATLQADLKVA